MRRTRAVRDRWSEGRTDSSRGSRLILFVRSDPVRSSGFRLPVSGARDIRGGPGWMHALFELLAGELYKALGSEARAIDHIGSTSVPGLAAKDCVDVQVRVAAIQEARQVGLLAAIGFRCRPEPWNRAEISGGQECRKLVFAPPVGARRCNVRLRREGEPNCRYALLFRDYLRADEAARRQWGAFKRRLAHSVPDLQDAGRSRPWPPRS